MILSAEDLTTAARIIFALRGIKLWKNEPHKKLIRGKLISIPGIGYPPGSPDLMGWDVKNGQVVGVEIKTVNDQLSAKQKKFLTMMGMDFCLPFLFRQKKNGKTELLNWQTGEIEIFEKVEAYAEKN